MKASGRDLRAQQENSMAHERLQLSQRQIKSVIFIWHSLGVFSSSQPNSALGFLPINLPDVFQWEVEADNLRAESDRGLVKGHRGSPKTLPGNSSPALTQAHLLAAICNDASSSFSPDLGWRESVRRFASFERDGLQLRFNFHYLLSNFWRWAGESLVALLPLFALGFQLSLKLFTLLDSCSYSLHLLSNAAFELYTWEGAACPDQEAAVLQGAGGPHSS